MELSSQPDREVCTAPNKGSYAGTRHIDCSYCLLQLMRVPFLIRWTVTLWLAHVKSPAILSWQHGVKVTP